ncbi:MAG: sigma-70 family RNA polymerase sigma factor [Planctomycetes bacterium]|nr:sigma-70 family RNA polymerase sigma factor [Planctomycetota bacterium]
MDEKETGKHNPDANAIFARYSRRLAALAHQNMSARLRTRIDGEDVAQSVLRTFFRRSEMEEFQLDESTDLWKLLVKITITKVHNRARYHRADKRNVDREEGGREGESLEHLLASGPGPAEAAELAEQLERLLADLPPAHREICALIVQGYSRTEVAEQLNLSRMTVHRVLKLLQGKLSDEESD